jgi:hypothetical protein
VQAERQRRSPRRNSHSGCGDLRQFRTAPRPCWDRAVRHRIFGAPRGGSAGLPRPRCASGTAAPACRLLRACASTGGLEQARTDGSAGARGARHSWRRAATRTASQSPRPAAEHPRAAASPYSRGTSDAIGSFISFPCSDRQYENCASARARPQPEARPALRTRPDIGLEVGYGDASRDRGKQLELVEHDGLGGPAAGRRTRPARRGSASRPSVGRRLCVASRLLTAPTRICAAPGPTPPRRGDGEETIAQVKLDRETSCGPQDRQVRSRTVSSRASSHRRPEGGGGVGCRRPEGSAAWAANGPIRRACREAAARMTPVRGAPLARQLGGGGGQRAGPERGASPCHGHPRARCRP